MDEGWDVLSEDEEFRDALAVELFGAEPPEDALAEVDWVGCGLGLAGVNLSKNASRTKSTNFPRREGHQPPCPWPPKWL